MMIKDAYRRRLMKTAMAGAGLTLLPEVFAPKLAFATQGNLSLGSWAAASDPALWSLVWNNRFSNILPWALDPTNQVLINAGVPVPAATPNVGFIYHPDAGTASTFSVKAGQINWPMLAPLGNLLGIPTTKLWGYGNRELEVLGIGVTFPGRSFVIQRGTPITVNWYNNLVDTAGMPLPHLVGVDQTITMQTDVTGAAINGVPIAIHHHGGANQAEFDGGPDQWFTPQRRQIGPGVTNVNTSAGSDHLSYRYENNQEASLHWYHDHGAGVTRINAYAGLAGLYVVRDKNENAMIIDFLLPTGPYEVPIVIQDKIFQADGSLAYTGDIPALNGWNTTSVSPLPGFGYNPANPATVSAGGQPTAVPEMFGDLICVNGVAWPNLKVEPRQYRLRLLNGSDSRVYNLNFGGQSFWQISTDLGFLNYPVPMNTITIFPGERKDILIDFTSATGRKLVVTNDAATPFPTGALPTTGTDTIMQFDVTKALDTSKYRTTHMKLQTPLRGYDPATPFLAIVNAASKTLPVRKIMLAEGADEYGRIMPLLGTVAEGTKTFNEPADIIAALNSTEIWEFWNSTVDSHPIHMHLVQFRILNRQNFTGAVQEKNMANGWFGVKFIAPPVLSRGRATSAPPAEQGWKDTVVCPPGQVTRVQVTFDRPGKYVYHCHILGHEEHDMMRWYQVI
jgi:spore coat protein A